MDHCRGFEQNSFFTRCEEKRGLVSVLDRKDFVACPRPRRVSLLSQSSPKPLRCEISHQTEICNSKAGVELLDILLMKDESRKEPPQYAPPRLGSSPPFFDGSPPSRVSNALIQDARFMAGINPIAQLFNDAPPLDLPYPVSSARKVNDTTGAAAAQVKGFNILSREHNNTSVAVRVEGFDIRRGNSQIPRVEGGLNRGGRVESLDRGRGNFRVSAAA